MVEKKSRKRARWFGLIIGVMLMSLVFSLVGEVKTVEAVGGAYTIKFRAGATDDYIPSIPYPGTGVIPNTAPPTWGSADGSLLIPGADFLGTTSLSPKDMALCQIVPYFFQIVVNGDTSPELGSIIVKAEWDTQATSGAEFGFNKDIMVYSAFVDTSDITSVDLDGNENVTLLTEQWIYKLGDDVAFEGIFQVDGLDTGDTVVVEVWVVLDCVKPASVGGTIQGAATGAYTVGLEDTINVGQETNPSKADDFDPAPVSLEVYKYDDDIPKQLLGGTPPFYSLPWKNTVVVNALTEGDLAIDYVANDVVVVDTLDPWVQYLGSYTITNDYSGYRTCSWADDDTDGLGGTLTCNLQAVAELETVTIEYDVRAVSGVQIGSICEGAHEELPATLIIDSGGGCVGPTYLSLQGYDVMNRVELSTVSGDITLDDNWDEEPKDINYPTGVEIDYFEATGKFKSVLLEWMPTPGSEYQGFNLYRAETVDGDRVMINDELILVDFGATEYTYTDTGPRQGLRPNKTYYYWLEAVDLSGSPTLSEEPAEATVTPHKFK